MLTLLSYIYWLLWALRKYLYDTRLLRIRRLPSPVISIGNLTVGGTGKTPAVIAVSRILQDMNQKIAVLSRGYKRRSSSPVLVVSDGKRLLSSPEDSGDEPYLIASTLEHVPVIVGPDRYDAGKLASDSFGTRLFVLDDGYQHIRLHRDVNILMIDATNPVGNRYLLPKGILREPLKEVSRADCVIISRVNEGDKESSAGLIRSYNKDAPIFSACYRPVSLKDLEGNTFALGHISGKRLFLFSGIGNPASFKRSIEEAGGKIEGVMTFPDHHWYGEKDIGKIMTEAGRHHADIIVTTAKDAVRLAGRRIIDHSSMPIQILALQVVLEMDNGFQDWIRNVVERMTSY